MNDDLAWLFLIIRIDTAEVLGAINPLQTPGYMGAGHAALLLFA